MNSVFGHNFRSLAAANKTERSFPKDFLWAVSTSAYQIEGAWAEGGKGESIWDRYTHRNGTILGNTNGNVAADSYHLVGELNPTYGI